MELPIPSYFDKGYYCSCPLEHLKLQEKFMKLWIVYTIFRDYHLRIMLHPSVSSQVHLSIWAEKIYLLLERHVDFVITFQNKSVCYCTYIRHDQLVTLPPSHPHLSSPTPPPLSSLWERGEIVCIFIFLYLPKTTTVPFVQPMFGQWSWDSPCKYPAGHHKSWKTCHIGELTYWNLYISKFEAIFTEARELESGGQMIRIH
jgi:hypothetical protein